jgi:hypothetical protein
MLQLLAHLVGDYVLQNHWMANNKTKPGPEGFMAAWIHAILYGIPFMFLVPSGSHLAIIVLTHFAIDRYRLAKLWVAFWGVGRLGWVLGTLNEALPSSRGRDGSVEPFFSDPGEPPPWMAVWLLIIVDNTMHLAINYFTLTLGG